MSLIYFKFPICVSFSNASYFQNICNFNTAGLWRWDMTHRHDLIFLDYIHRLKFYERHTTFLILLCFRLWVRKKARNVGL